MWARVRVSVTVRVRVMVRVNLDPNPNPFLSLTLTHKAKQQLKIIKARILQNENKLQDYHMKTFLYVVIFVQLTVNFVRSALSAAIFVFPLFDSFLPQVLVCPGLLLCKLVKQ